MDQLSNHPDPERRRWMSVLARARPADLAALLGDAVPEYRIVRGPEAGLVMVRGRAGGGGAAFNLGEMTVTRCTVRLSGGQIGHAYVQGRNQRLAELAAVADAMMQVPDWAADVEVRVIAPLEKDQQVRRAERAAKAAATRVQFFAMQTMRT